MSTLAEKESGKVGFHIRAIREQLGITQMELARRISRTPQHMNHLEQSNAGLQTWSLCAIARALHCTPNDLLGWEDTHGNDGTNQ